MKQVIPEHKDAAGDRFNVGDVVAYNPGGGYVDMKIGIVVGFTPKMVQVGTGGYTYQGNRDLTILNRMPGVCVRTPHVAKPEWAKEFNL